MVCPVCNQRKAKRTCPALGKQICTVCCGTKRLVEINCPADCGYLASSRAHPPAVVQRQQELDRAMLLPVVQGLSDRQARVFLMLASVAARHQGEMLQKVLDEDIAQAAGALAATLETAGRGILYEHQPASLPAARLMGDLKGVVDDLTKNGGSAFEREAAVGLRRIEQGARAMAAVRPGTNEFQQLLNRVFVLPPTSADHSEQAPAPTAPSLVIP